MPNLVFELVLITSHTHSSTYENLSPRTYAAFVLLYYFRPGAFNHTTLQTSDSPISIKWFFLSFHSTHRHHRRRSLLMQDMQNVINDISNRWITPRMWWIRMFCHRRSAKNPIMAARFMCARAHFTVSSCSCTFISETKWALLWCGFQSQQHFEIERGAS